MGGWGAGMEQGRGWDERDPGWPGGLFLNSRLQAPLAFLEGGWGRPHPAPPGRLGFNLRQASAPRSLLVCGLSH